MGLPLHPEELFGVLLKVRLVHQGLNFQAQRGLGFELTVGRYIEVLSHIEATSSQELAAFLTLVVEAAHR